MPIFMKMDGIDGDIGRGSNAGSDHTVTGHECLVFFLGGMPGGPADFGGFLGGVTVAAGDISDGTSNTFLFTEIHRAAGDGDGPDLIGNPEENAGSGYVLTSTQHTAIDTSYGAVRRHLERDCFRLSRNHAPAFCLSMIFSENRHPLFRIML